MSDEVIKSRTNAQVKLARAVRDGKQRELIFLEGVRLCEEAARAGLDVEQVFYTEKLTRDERGVRLLDALGRARRLTPVSQDVLDSISDTKTPQGVVALARRPPTGREALEKDGGEIPLVVVMHRAGNPANAGAMMRVAEAAGATGVISTVGSADLFSPKALRGAMGSSLRLPIWSGADFGEALRWCAARGIKSVSTSLRAAHTHTEIDWRSPCAVLVGAEGEGLTEEEAEVADARIRIPMRPPVESLNVAVALAVVLYEAVRQRSQV